MPFGPPHPPLTESLIQKFWSYVQKTDDCWLWTRPLARHGYGQFWFLHEGKPYRPVVHRLSYELLVGPIPPGLLVCHQCDVRYPVGDFTYRRCVNPDHLFLGTYHDNRADMVAKQRGGIGALNGRALLTSDDVRAIRAQYPVRTLKQLGLDYGVNWRTIWRIVNGETWRHLL